MLRGDIVSERNIVWKCPKCPFETKQPEAVSAVSHLCGLGKRSTALVRQEPELDGMDLI